MPLRKGRQIFLHYHDQELTCEICGTVVIAANAFSIFVDYCMPGPRKTDDPPEVHRYAGARCEAVQHFYCSHEHAVLGALVCLLHHMDDDVPHNGAITDPWLLDIKEQVRKHT